MTESEIKKKEEVEIIINSFIECMQKVMSQLGYKYNHEAAYICSIFMDTSIATLFKMFDSDSSHIRELCEDSIRRCVLIESEMRKENIKYS